MQKKIRIIGVGLNVGASEQAIFEILKKSLTQETMLPMELETYFYNGDITDKTIQFNRKVRDVNQKFCEIKKKCNG